MYTDCEFRIAQVDESFAANQPARLLNEMEGLHRGRIGDRETSGEALRMDHIEVPVYNTLFSTTDFAAC